MRYPLIALCLVLAALTPSYARPVTPQIAVDELLSADRAYAAKASEAGLIVGLSAMIDAKGIVPAPDAKFARGPADVGTLLASNPQNAGSRVIWAPVRGGISADLQHGFTFGHLTITRANGVTEPFKYLAYWIKRPAGWRVLAYQRTRRKDGEVSTRMLAPSLPRSTVAPVSDARQQVRDRASLAAAEHGFSDLAQRIGLGPAFGQVGTDDAVLVSLGTDFVIGAKNIARQGFGPETTSAVSWSSAGTETASSGDLGLSWGVVRPNQGAKGEPFSFFTVWRRERPSERWKFVAE